MITCCSFSSGRSVSTLWEAEGIFMVISHEVYWELSKETSGKTHECSDFECFTSLTYSCNNLLVGPSEI